MFGPKPYSRLTGPSHPRQWSGRAGVNAPATQSGVVYAGAILQVHDVHVDVGANEWSSEEKLRLPSGSLAPCRRGGQGVMVPNYPVSSAGVKESSQGKHIPIPANSEKPRRPGPVGTSNLETADFPLKQDLLLLAQSRNAVALGQQRGNSHGWGVSGLRQDSPPGVPHGGLHEG